MRCVSRMESHCVIWSVSRVRQIPCAPAGCEASIMGLGRGTCTADVPTASAALATAPAVSILNRPAPARVCVHTCMCALEHVVHHISIDLQVHTPTWVRHKCLRPNSGDSATSPSSDSCRSPHRSSRVSWLSDARAHTALLGILKPL